ncbi:cathepsin L1-like isoform X2 [Zalophus californianus]|uniref:Procathepsin L n=1 Tax=Zalophus californianus TaxID=9704 RepID=A0A6J2EYQ8_ZALCA|nr:cathepsin L1-like isoform X2 [Zalophus californianus]
MHRPILETCPPSPTFLHIFLSPVSLLCRKRQCSWCLRRTDVPENWQTRVTEQNLLDCFLSQGNEGCHGGLMDYAFQHVRNNGGLDSEESDPYCAQDGSCEYMPDSSAANVTGLVNIPQQVASLLVAVAAVGPVSAAVRASLDPFRFYKEGIYYDPNCSSEDLDHGTLVVGYDSQGEEPENQKYWNVKNSWGTDRGTQGYMLLAKDRDNQCGIATMARFPVV